MRAKFTLTSVTDWGSCKELSFRAVTGGHGNVNAENVGFWKATPAGEVKLTVDNLPAVEGMKPGDEFYVDFTKAK